MDAHRAHRGDLGVIVAGGYSTGATVDRYSPTLPLASVIPPPSAVHDRRKRRAPTIT